MAKPITAGQLKVILDEKLDQKLTPLTLKVSDMSAKVEEAMRFIECVYSQYEEAMTKVEIYEKERIKL